MNEFSKHILDYEFRCNEVLERIEYIDDYTAFKLMQKYFPKYDKYSSIYSLISDYSEQVKEDTNSCFALPMSFMKQHLVLNSVQDSKKLYYDLIDSLINTQGHKLLIGIDYNKYDEIIDSFIKAVDFAVCVEKTYFNYSEEAVINIDYKPRDDNQRIFIVKNNNGLTAMIEWCEIDYDYLFAQNISRSIEIPKNISDKVMELLRHGLPLEPYGHLAWICDDRWCGNDIFRITLSTKEMDPPCNSEWYLSDHVYFDKGKKPDKKELADMMDYLYENMTEQERKMFPYKQKE